MNPSTRRGALLSFLTLTTALYGCASGNLPDYIQLGDLRVLALKADVPEVDPTSALPVTLTPVVSDLNAGRSLSYTAVGCIDPGVGYGASPNCANAQSATPLASGTIPALDPTTHTNTGTAPTFPVSIPSTILANRNSIDQSNGVAYLVVYTLTAAANSTAGASQVVSYKRIIASNRAVKNKNPQLNDVTVGSQSLASYLTTLTFPFSGTNPSLTPALEPGSAETYTRVNSDGRQSSLTEQLVTTWFISDGSIAFYRTTGNDSVGWTPPSAQPTTPGGSSRGLLFVAVTRDGRGGEDFKLITH